MPENRDRIARVDFGVARQRLFAHMLPGSEQKAACAASGIVHGFLGLGIDHRHHCVDQRTRREILPRADFHLLRIAFEQALVDRALDVDTEPSQVSPSIRPTSRRSFAGSWISFCALRKIVPTMPDMARQFVEDRGIAPRQLLALQVAQYRPAAILRDR